MTPKRVAIIGSGCAGLGALWALKDGEHEVHLFEADERLGGHTNTVAFRGKSDEDITVDTGFIVFNQATYRKPPIPAPQLSSVVDRASQLHQLPQA